MDDATQRDVLFELTRDFLRGELDGDEDRYATLLCDLPASMVDHRSRSHAPATTATAESDDVASVGIAGLPGEVVLFAGPGPGSSTMDGVAVDLADALELGRTDAPDGVACLTEALPEGLAGAAWLQAVVITDDDAVPGRTIDLFDVGAPEPEPGDDDDSAEPDPEADDDDAVEADDDDATEEPAAPAIEGDGCEAGCRAAPTGGLLLLPLLALRRWAGSHSRRAGA
jgi:hypothetical protein